MYQNDIVVFNTFSNQKYYKKIKEFDILIWTVSLLQYKSFGYKTKIFCTKNDIDFLKKYHLFSLYDEIDTDLFETSELLKKINDTNFWSCRKIIAIDYQLNLYPRSVYSDTDVIMKVPFDLTYDCIFWCEEQPREGSVYLRWKKLSTPEGYKMPDFIKQEKRAYNCGVMWFKYRDVFDFYKEQYLNFVIDNPCILNDEGYNIPLIFTTNAEQRILEACCKFLGQRTHLIEDDADIGCSKDGLHIFGNKNVWKSIPAVEEAIEAEENPEKKEQMIKAVFEVRQEMNFILEYCLKYLADYEELFHFWYTESMFADFIEKAEKDLNHFVIYYYE